MARLVLLLVSLAAACSGHGSSNSPPDVPDVDPPPPVNGIVSLRITADGAPRPGVTVIFQNANSLVVDTLITDATGFVEARMGTNSFVTAINPFGPPGTGELDDVRTFAGVEPHDELTLDQDTRSVTLDVTVSGPTQAGAARYELFTTCGGGALPVGGKSFALRNCGAAADFMIVTYDASNAPLGFLTQTNVGVVDGGTIALTGTYVAVPVVNYNYFGADNLGVIDATHVLSTPRGRLIATEFDVSISGGNNGQAMVKVPSLPGTSTLTVSRVTRTDGIASHGVLDWGASSSSHFIDLFQQLNHEIIEAPFFQPPRSVSWQEAFFQPLLLESIAPVDPTEPDFSRVELEMTRPSTSKKWRWTIAAPHHGPFIGGPTLPPAAAPFDSNTGDTGAVISLSTWRVIGGYDAVRKTALSFARAEELMAGRPQGRLMFHEYRTP